MSEFGDRIAGYCQNCEQDVDGAIVGTGRQAGARMYRVKTSDGREHRIVEGVTQTILSQYEIDQRIKRRKERELENSFYEATGSAAAQQEYSKITDTTSSTEYEAPAEEETQEFQ